MSVCNPSSETDGVLSPHLCNKGSLLIPTHLLLVAWHISAILSQQEPVEEAKKERGLSICFVHEKILNSVSG